MAWVGKVKALYFSCILELMLSKSAVCFNLKTGLDPRWKSMTLSVLSATFVYEQLFNVFVFRL